MKKSILFFIVFTLSNFTYASFPVNETLNSEIYSENYDVTFGVDDFNLSDEVNDVKLSKRVKRLYTWAAILLAIVVITLSVIIVNAIKCLDDRTHCNNETNNGGASGALFLMNILALVSLGLALRARKIKRKESRSL